MSFFSIRCFESDQIATTPPVGFFRGCEIKSNNDNILKTELSVGVQNGSACHSSNCRATISHSYPGCEAAGFPGYCRALKRVIIVDQVKVPEIL